MAQNLGVDVKVVVLIVKTSVLRSEVSVKPQSATTLPPSPTDDRRARMVKYTAAMGVRVGCIVALVFVSGWWLLVFAIGAIVLPYFAVIIANVHGAPQKSAMRRPGTLARRDAPHSTGPGSST